MASSVDRFWQCIGQFIDLKGESGGTGRRTGLRIQLWKQNGSSNLPSRTSFLYPACSDFSDANQLCSGGYAV